MDIVSLEKWLTQSCRLVAPTVGGAMTVLRWGIASWEMR